MGVKRAAQTKHHAKKAILLMIAATLLNSTAQLLYKNSINNAGLDIIALALQGTIILGLFAYAVSGLLMILALKDGEASKLYPIYTLSFVWIALGSKIFFAEHITSTALAGMGAVVAGILLINIEPHHKKKTRRKTQK